MSTDTNAIASSSLHHRYEIQHEIGAGATGTVYLARDTFEQRDVALKVALPQIFAGNNPEQTLIRKAWLNEVHLAGSLQHPYIVAVYDAGVSADSAYLVMEYLAHGTLQPYTRPDNLKPVAEVLEIIYKCASALDYACRAGIVHRDIKPANLQYVGPGEAKVCDFGAAYWAKNDSTQVMDIGSLAYMAPELFRHWVTPQADIYALGIVLFQLLTGQQVFHADTPAALMYQIMNGEPPRLSELRADTPPELETLVTRMIARSLEDRFPDWPAVLAALSTLLPKLETEQTSGEILVRLSDDRLEVNDTGIGIPEERFAEIFKRHSKGAESAGAGIGLSIVSRVAELLNWQVELESERGKGTRVTVVFPQP